MDQLVVVPVETVGVVVGAVEEEEEELAETRVAARVEVVGKLAEEDLGPATAEDLPGTAELEARELDRAGDLEDAVTAEVVAGNSSSSLICDDGVARD